MSLEHISISSQTFHYHQPAYHTMMPEDFIAKRLEMFTISDLLTMIFVSLSTNLLESSALPDFLKASVPPVHEAVVLASHHRQTRHGAGVRHARHLLDLLLVVEPAYSSITGKH